MIGNYIATALGVGVLVLGFLTGFGLVDPPSAHQVAATAEIGFGLAMLLLVAGYGR